MQTNRRTWQSFDEMRKAAEQGDAAAQCYFGICYQTGQGVAQDYVEAVRWFRRPPTRTTRRRSVIWVSVTSPGWGCPQEYGQAAKWFREAAEQGDPAAQFNLGVLYETGQGVPQNYADAVKWYHLGGGAGRTAGAVQPRGVLRNGPGGAAEFRGGGEVVSAAAEQECAPAQCNLGLCYETGRGVPKNVREAVKWFCRAARAGDKTAQHNLGVYYASVEAAEQAAAAGETPTATPSDATA